MHSSPGLGRSAPRHAPAAPQPMNPPRRLALTAALFRPLPPAPAGLPPRPGAAAACMTCSLSSVGSRAWRSLVSLFNDMASRGYGPLVEDHLLAGYTVFYGTGTALFRGGEIHQPLLHPFGHAIAVMTFWVPTFLVLFLLFYKLGRKWTGLTRSSPPARCPCPRRCCSSRWASACSRD